MILVNKFWGSMLKDREEGGLSVKEFVELFERVDGQKLKVIRAIAEGLPVASRGSLGTSEEAPQHQEKRRVQK